MKHSSVFISYLGYWTLFWKAMLDHDNEKSLYYLNEMDDNIHKMNIDELLELLTILDVFYSDRQR